MVPLLPDQDRSASEMFGSERETTGALEGCEGNKPPLVSARELGSNSVKMSDARRPPFFHLWCKGR